MHLQVLALRAEQLVSLRKNTERRRTHVGTGRKAEREHDHLASMAAEFQLGAVGALQREIGRDSRRVKDARSQGRVCCDYSRQ